jgi:hypothetical protein
MVLLQVVTVTFDVVALQLFESVKVNVTVPVVAPADTAPALVTVALPVSLLDQVPPDVGDKEVVPIF